MANKIKLKLSPIELSSLFSVLLFYISVKRSLEKKQCTEQPIMHKNVGTMDTNLFSLHYFRPLVKFKPQEVNKTKTKFLKMSTLIYFCVVWYICDTNVEALLSKVVFTYGVSPKTSSQIGYVWWEPRGMFIETPPRLYDVV